MNWHVRIAKSARKKLARFPKKDQLSIADALRDFVFNPYAGDIEKIADEENVWRRRVGNYRIVYEINISHKSIEISDIRRRTSKTYSR